MPIDPFPPVPSPHLVLGGAKSGKSAYAEQAILAFPPPYIYIATAQILDDEMKERVHRHRERRDTRWETLECPIKLVEALESLRGKGRAVLVDCLTLWLSNLLLAYSAAHAQACAKDLCAFLDDVDYPLLLVTNEVGSGIVPENPLARQFRDLAGSTNQSLASVCPGVTLVVAGLPLHLKTAPTITS